MYYLCLFLVAVIIAVLVGLLVRYVVDRCVSSFYWYMRHYYGKDR